MALTSCIQPMIIASTEADRIALVTAPTGTTCFVTATKISYVWDLSLALWVAVPVFEPINNQTLNYNMVITDANKLIICTKATQLVLGIPNDATVNFPLGTRIRFFQGGVGQIAFAPVAPCVLLSYLNKNKSIGLYASCYIKKIAINIWSLTGDIST